MGAASLKGRENWMNDESPKPGSLLILEPRLMKSQFWSAYTSNGFGQTRMQKKIYLATEMKHCKLALGGPH